MAKSRGLNVVLRATGRGGGRGEFEYKVEDGQKGHQRDESRVCGWLFTWVGRRHDTWYLCLVAWTGESDGCSVGGADGSTDGVLLGVEVGTVEGEFDGSVLGFRLGTSNHDGKAIGAKVGELLDNTEGGSEVELIATWMMDCLVFSGVGYLVSMVVWQRGGHLEM